MNLAFVGDITPGGTFLQKGGPSKEILDYLSSFTFRIGTLESAMGDGRTLCHIKMSDPTLGTIIFSPDEAIKMLLALHIDAVSLANNHVCDCDLVGLDHTIKLLDEYGIAHFGAGRNKEEASKPVILNYEGKTVCLLGYLKEYRYLYRGTGYHPTDMCGGTNIYEIDKVLSDVKKYSKQYDYVFVLPHWGKEGSMVPKKSEIEDARKMIAAGASGVVASHAHIVQPVCKFNKGIIAMNLGNFAFPDRYVIPPRVSYYPTPEEIGGQVIPIIKEFKCVNRLSYKVVSNTERLGAIVSISLKNKISYTIRYTFLDENEMIRFHQPAFPFLVKQVFYSLFIIDQSGIIQKLYNKFVK